MDIEGAEGEVLAALKSDGLDCHIICVKTHT
jgi:hypothetical protein